jgi:hypothetical protein
VSYRQLLAAMFMAGIRNMDPQPCGFQLHCVFVMHSVHQMCLDAPAGDRLQPGRLPVSWSTRNGSPIDVG